MCGRFRQRLKPEVLQEVFELDQLLAFPEQLDIFPKKYAVVIRQQADTGKREAESMYWSLIPHWHNGDYKKFKFTTYNATREKVATSPIFRDAFQRRRCLVPAERWYEYIGEKGSRQPVAFEEEGDAPFAFAGIWETNPFQAEPFASFTILTAPANEFVQAYHTRMPIVLPRAAYADWLDPSPRKPKELEAFLQPWLPDHFRARLEPIPVRGGKKAETARKPPRSKKSAEESKLFSDI